MRLTKFGFLMTLIASPLCMEAENLDVKRIEIDKEKSVDFLSCDAIGKQGLILTTKDDDNQKNTQKGHNRLTFTKYDTLLNKVTSVDAEITTTVP